jgi:hypothetical protein
MFNKSLDTCFRAIDGIEEKIDENKQSLEPLENNIKKTERIKS